MRDRRFHFAIDCAVLLACVLAGCEGDDDTDPPGSRPNAPIDLWELPGGLVGSQGGTNGAVPGVHAFDAGSMTQPEALDAAALWDDDGSIPPDMQPDPSLDRLDPTQVYIFGSLSEFVGHRFVGARYAVAKVTAPNHALVGFSGEADSMSAQIRASDGAMLYRETNSSEVTVFHCDGCTYQRVGDLGYPSDPSANDDVLTHPVCMDASASKFRLAQDGTIYHSCDGNDWHDPTGKTVATGNLLAVNAMQFALMDTHLIDLATSTVIEFDGLSANAIILAVRARGNEFWVAVVYSETAALAELWRIQDDGTAIVEGRYPVAPPGQTIRPNGAALDGRGRLVQFASDGTRYGTIVRRSIQDESKVIYDERDDPVVKLRMAGLFTGP